MKFKYIYILFFFITSCTQHANFIKKENIEIKKSFTSKGFTLIYEDVFFKDKLINKKLNNSESVIIHSFLRVGSFVEIFNPTNSKSVIAKVKYKTSYPVIYNSVITKKIAFELNLDINEPYIEIIELKKNATFIAKKSKIFEEEKNVANTAPITDININIISSNEKDQKSKNIKYIIVVGEYYFKDSAINLKNKLINEGKISNIKIDKISENKFRVYSGSFNSFLTMKKTYFAINNLGFEHLDIIKIK